MTDTNSKPMTPEAFIGMNATAQQITLNKAFHYDQDKSVEDAILAAFNDRNMFPCLTGVIGDIAVIKTQGPNSFDGAPFTALILVDEQWKRIHRHYETVDEAILGALGHKHCGSNSQFDHFSTKMLGIVKS